MLFFRIFFIFICASFLGHGLSSPSIFAAGTIPRDNLRLELILATGSVDTSGLLRTVTSTGIGPSYITDSMYGIPYAKFSGSGGIQATTGWSASSSDDFTLSLWVRVRASELPVLTGMVLPSTSVPPYGWVGGVTTHYLATLFSSQLNANVNSLNLRLRSDYKCALGGVNTRPPGLFYLDAINNPSFFIDCSKLSDEKWHNIILRRYNNLLSVRIDSQDIYSSQSDMTLGRIITIGSFLQTVNTGALAYSMGQDPKATSYHSFFRGGIAGVRLYSRSLTDAEVGILSEEYQFARSDLVGAGNIQISLEGYTQPTLKYLLKSIPLNMNKSNIQYQYSLDGKNFMVIDPATIQDISVGTGSLTYRFGIGLSSVPDGNITLTLRGKSGTVFQNIGTIKFVKSDQVYTINIAQPDTTLSPTKTISASLSTTGVLSMSLTRGNICDATLTFEDYSDLVFTSKADNSLRICYKGYFPSLAKTLFKLSEPILGINSVSNTSLTAKIFDEYLYWTRSLYPRFNDSANLVLDLLSVNSTSSNGTINGVTLTDINGDGLVDFLYSRSDPVRRAIIVNNGNYSFKITYKCAIDGTYYYGDCADTNR